MFDADLAAFHDAHSTDLPAEAATTLVDDLAEAGHHTGLVADLGCGAGVLAALMLDAGYGVMAVDPSPAQLALTARRAPDATPVQATLADVSLPDGLAGIACVGEVLSYDLRIDLDETAERFHAALRPGGVLILDVPGPGRHGGVDTVTVDDRDRALMAVETRERGFRLERTITLFTEMTDGSYRRSSELHELRLYEPDDVRTALSRAGFVAIRRLRRYGARGPTFTEGWSAFVAERDW